MKKSVFIRYATCKLTSFAVCIITLISGCDQPQLSEQIEPGRSIAALVSGVYSGTGTFMPEHVLISRTEVCSVPNWESLLRKGEASAIISEINDSTVNVALKGLVYTTTYSHNFVLRKNGNQVSNQSGNLVFYISTGSFQFESIRNGVTFPSNECGSINKYYLVSIGFLTSPPSPRFFYYSVGNWGFIGNK